ERDDNDNGEANQDYAGSHQGAALFATADLADVFPHDVGWAEPDENLEREVADKNPVEFADDWNHVEFECRRCQHKQQTHPRYHFREHRHAFVGDQPVKQADELRQEHHQPAQLHRPEELHAKHRSKHQLNPTTSYSSTARRRRCPAAGVFLLQLAAIEEGEAERRGTWRWAISWSPTCASLACRTSSGSPVTSRSSCFSRWAASTGW